MDIVDFWSKQVAKWATENKCGLCWDYGAPLVQSQANIVKSTDGKECCVNIFVTDLSTKENINYGITGLRVDPSCDYTFTVWAVTAVPLGVNNYNEIKNHPIDESKWVTVFKPIQECLSCDAVLDFCTLLGNDVKLMAKSGVLVHNWQDKNYNGWRYTMTFRINIK